jgi:small subunit ribosomal protein S20
MPHHKSTAKRVRTNEKSRVRNHTGLSRIRSAVKRVREAGNAEEGQAALKTAISQLDRGAKHGLIKHGTVDRTKSRLTKHIKKIPA